MIRNHSVKGRTLQFVRDVASGSSRRQVEECFSFLKAAYESPDAPDGVKNLAISRLVNTLHRFHSPILIQGSGCVVDLLLGFYPLNYWSKQKPSFMPSNAFLDSVNWAPTSFTNGLRQQKRDKRGRFSR